MLKSYLGLISIVLFLVSCEKKFPEFLKVEEDIYLKLISFEESQREFKKEDYASFSILIKDQGEIIYRHYKEEVLLNNTNNFSFLIKNLNQGDSAVFKVSTTLISETLNPFLKGILKEPFIEVSIKIHNYFSVEEYLGYKKGVDKEMNEQILLTQYLEELNAVKMNGVFKEVLNVGEGDFVKNGDEVTIAYTGYFINRLKFDENLGSTAFTFKYGTQGQVVDGLNFAIKSMREREKSKIIIPSQLAFGEEGSTTLIVPAFTTVIYELEILKIN
jgi:hypothetical protein